MMQRIHTLWQFFTNRLFGASRQADVLAERHSQADPLSTPMRREQLRLDRLADSDQRVQRARQELLRAAGAEIQAAVEKLNEQQAPHSQGQPDSNSPSNSALLKGARRDYPEVQQDRDLWLTQETLEKMK